MNRNYQIMNGMERITCRGEGARLEGMFGLAGLGSVETFTDLRNVLRDSGFVDAESYMRQLEARHARQCSRIKKALPVATVVTRMLQAASDNPARLNGLKKEIKKALKSTDVAKIQKALTKEQAKIDKAPGSKKVAKRIDYVNQLTAQLAKATAAGATPVEAGTSVLAQESGVNFATPAAQDFAQQLVASSAAPGSTVPAESMFDAPPEAPAAASDGTILGMSPLVAGLAGVGVLGAFYLLMRRR